MMQHSVCPPEQALSNQHQAMGHQMVLCPVRFVYETQILMPPSDQIHPNQAILINPQNTPPWIQNRQISNPIVYVQQVPSNIIPSHQQHIDQNQLYMQQIANYQMPQPIQSQEQMRPNIQMMQMTNIGANMQVERNVGPTMTNYSQSTNQLQPQMIVPHRQVVNVGQNTVYAQSELQRQLFMNVRPVANQTRPMSVNPTQNLQQNVNVSMPAQHNFGQTFVPNVGLRPQVPANIKTEVVKTEATNLIPGPRAVHNSAYKPIQPRPQFRQYNTTITQTPIQMTAPKPPPTTRIVNQPTKINYYINNDNFNRKRKSESPDEIKKKVAINTTKLEPLKYGSMIVKSVTSMDIGVNTSPVHKIPQNTPKLANTTIVGKEIDPKVIPKAKEFQGSDFKELTINTDPLANMTIIEALKADPPQSLSQEEKLIRQTVFTQAKGRVLNDKEFRANTIENMQQNLDDFNKMQRASNELIPTKIVSDTSSNQFNDFVKPEIPIIKADNTKKEVKEVRKEEAAAPPDVTEEKKGKVNEIEVKHENEFVLTHVLDGFVIQESNVAFPIRKPLKERTIQVNAQEKQELGLTKQEMKEELTEDRAEELPLPFHCLQLNNEKKEESAVKEENIDNPFASLQHSTVKDWTIGQMTSHLLKYGWSETLSLLQEQEIDGESLFLATKSQLLRIGIKETHADIICDFVKS